MAKRKFYVVWHGRKPGVYDSWNACKAQVDGYAGAEFKSYPTREKAEAAFADPAGLTQTVEATGDVPHQAALDAGHAAVYTDGGSEGNPGPGGYGVVVLVGDTRRELSAGFRRTTNNRMELLGWITGLEAVDGDRPVVVFSDSKYVGQMLADGHATRWRERGWVKADKKPVANADLWRRLLELNDQLDVRFEWVKGHAGIPENERCDELATQALRGKDLSIDEAYEAGRTTIEDGLFG